MKALPCIFIEKTSAYNSVKRFDFNIRRDEKTERDAFTKNKKTTRIKLK